jgi:hypothetical protein
MAESRQETGWNRRGPMPPWPARCGLIGWLEMGNGERAQHIRGHAEKEGWSEAEIDRMVRYCDHFAALLEMDSAARVEQIRRDTEQAWSGFPDEIEHQSVRWITFWTELAADRDPEPGASSPPPASKERDITTKSQAARRPAHRPRGTTYRMIDLPLHLEMRRLIGEGIVPTISRAAWAVANRAWPPTSKLESKKRRLVATYPWHDSEPS